MFLHLSGVSLGVGLWDHRVPLCGVDYIFLTADDPEYLFMCFLAIHISSLVKCLFKKSHTYVLIVLFVFLTTEF